MSLSSLWPRVADRVSERARIRSTLAIQKRSGPVRVERLETRMVLESVPSRKAHTSRNRRLGAALVEFAIVAPIMFMMVLAIFEIGRALMVKELLTEAARRGCRRGVIEGTSTQQIQDAVTTFLTKAGINGENVGVSINDNPAGAVEAQNQPAYTEMTVTVTIPVSKVSWVPNPLYTSGTLSGQFTLRRE